MTGKRCAVMLVIASWPVTFATAGGMKGSVMMERSLRDHRVKIEFWSSPNTDWDASEYTPDNLQLLEDLKSVLPEFTDDEVLFTPQMYFDLVDDQNCNKESWKRAGQKERCPELCTNHGLYCVDEEKQTQLSVKYTGNDLITESVRRMCLWSLVEEVQTYWTYVNAVDECKVPFTEKCAASAMTAASINPEDLQGCIDQSHGVDNDEHKDREENAIIKSQLSHQDNMHYTLPVVLINGKPIEGQLDQAMLQAKICENFKEGEEPMVCLGVTEPPVLPTNPPVPTVAPTTATPVTPPPTIPKLESGGSDDMLELPDDDSPDDDDGFEQREELFFTADSKLYVELFQNAKSYVQSIEYSEDIKGVETGPFTGVIKTAMQILNGTAPSKESLEDALKFGHPCSFAQHLEMRQALREFKYCSSIDIMTLLETFPSIILGDVMRCIKSFNTYKKLQDQQENDGDLPIDCIRAVLGDNALGDAIRGTFLSPDVTCPCFDILADQLPHCTLTDTNTMPMDGNSLIKGSKMMGEICERRFMACETELEALNGCIPVHGEEIVCEDVIQKCQESTAFMTRLPYPLLGALLPDSCEKIAKENFGPNKLLERYERFSGKCGDRSILWEYTKSEDSFSAGFMASADVVSQTVSSRVLDILASKHYLFVDETSVTLLSGIFAGILLTIVFYIALSLVCFICRQFFRCVSYICCCCRVKRKNKKKKKRGYANVKQDEIATEDNEDEDAANVVT